LLAPLMSRFDRAARPGRDKQEQLRTGSNTQQEKRQDIKG
jgi:hypothetical protein